MNKTLVVVPCGKAKIWDKMGRIGPVRAEDAYVGAPFKVNKEYAKKVATRWVILSAKYGYIDPDFRIPGPYDVTFNDLDTRPVRVSKLCRQAISKRLRAYRRVIGLGGPQYREAIAASLERAGARLLFPTAGLPVGKAMRKLKRLGRQNRDL
jgi:hypothetical protein